MRRVATPYFRQKKRKVQLLETIDIDPLFYWRVAVLRCWDTRWRSLSKCDRQKRNALFTKLKL